MLGGHVERFEIVVVVLELRSFGDEEALAEEEALDPVAQQRERMTMADERRPTGERDVDCVRGRLAGGRLREAIGQVRVDVLFELVGLAAERGPLIRGRGGDILQQVRDRAVLARQVLVAQRADLRFGGGRATSRSNSCLSEEMSIRVLRFSGSRVLGFLGPGSSVLWFSGSLVRFDRSSNPEP